jgi:glycosyltransferase involved in cell wall biosynthesis
MGHLARSPRNLNGSTPRQRRLRLLWISQNLPYPPKTGVLQRNYNLVKQASTFADVHLLAIVKQDILPNFDPDAAEQALKELCVRVDTVRLPIEQSAIRFLAMAAASLFTTSPFTVNWATATVLRQAIVDAMSFQPDLVYFDTISLVGYRNLAGNTAKVLNHHNIESHLFDRRITYETNPLKRWYYGIEARKLRQCEAAVAAEFDSNLVCSSLDGDRLREICTGASTAVIANGVDVEYFQSRTRTAEPAHLVMVSGMNWFPNRDAVLYMTETIWPQLTQVLPRARLTIVGASPPPSVVALAARDPRVVVTGFVDDVRPYMESAQIYLCPMRDGGGTRLKILDALAMGMPIVATTMALEGIDVTPEREVLVADTPADFVRQIGRIVNDSGLAARLGQAGRVFVEDHFAWSVIGNDMQQTFDRLVKKRQLNA